VSLSLLAPVDRSIVFSFAPQQPHLLCLRLLASLYCAAPGCSLLALLRAAACCHLSAGSSIPPRGSSPSLCRVSPESLHPLPAFGTQADVAQLAVDVVLRPCHHSTYSRRAEIPRRSILHLAPCNRRRSSSSRPGSRSEFAVVDPTGARLARRRSPFAER
jgi:hypothetical protein